MRRFLLILMLLIVAAPVAVVAYLEVTACAVPPRAVFAIDEPSSLPPLPAPGDQSPEAWRSRTILDIHAMYRHLAQNTPIPYDEENPSYRNWLIKGREEALMRAGTVMGKAGLLFTLLAYANGFHDPHIAAGPVGELPPARWPGFIVSLSNGQPQIVHRDETDQTVPALGTVIKTCDGQPIDALLDSRIYPFRFNKGLASERRLAVTRLFLDRGNPFAPASTECTIEQHGKTSAFTLKWRPTPKQTDPWWDAYSAAASGPSTKWGVSEPSPGVFWIGIPTFSSGDDTSTELDKLLSEIQKQSEQMRNGKAIIIDTRGNGGGNSSWADKIAEAIFSPEVLAKFPVPSFDEAVDWRASNANAAFWIDWADQMAKEFGPVSINRLGAYYISWQLNRRKDMNPPIWRHGSCNPAKGGNLTTVRPNGNSPFQAKIFLLSNGTCGSSCLNFADKVLRVPGVKLIGEDTSGDGPYMEVREETLPSGVVSLTLPQKMNIGGGRAALEVYKVDVRYHGLWTDDAVRAWVMGLATEAK